MVTTSVAEKLEIDEIWKRYKADPNNQEYRNLLVENYLPLVKYNGERIWARLPEGVELDDLISAGVFGVPLGFAIIILVSLVTPAPKKEVQELVEHVRYPNLKSA